MQARKAAEEREELLQKEQQLNHEKERLEEQGLNLAKELNQRAQALENSETQMRALHDAM